MANSIEIIIRKTLAVLGLALVMSASVLPAVYAQGKSLKSAKHAEAVAPKTLEVVVFQVDNTLKFKVHLENHTSDDVTIKIKDAQNKVLFEEKVKNVNKYIRKFDFGTMTDGEYTFEVANRSETYRKDISLQTLSARTLHINE